MPQSMTDDNQDLFPIRTVSSITGVNSITLRAWERRYGLIKPVRTPKGHRLYTQNDIDLIQQVVGLLDKGISIGQVKQKLGSKPVKQANEETVNAWSAYQRRMINAITRFDTYALDQVYSEALSLYPVELVTQHLIIPLLKALGERWQKQEGSIAEEHFFGAYLRNKLGARIHHQGTSNKGPKIIAACLPGEQHEIGLMLFCLSASNAGLSPVYLGANTPIGEVKAPAEKTQAQAIIFSGSAGIDEKVFTDDLATLVGDIDIPVFIGGRSSSLYHDQITHAGAISLGADIQSAMRKITETIEQET